VARQLVGPGVEFAIAQLLPRVAHRQGLRRGGRLHLEQLMHQALAGERPLRVVETMQHPLAFGQVQQRQRGGGLALVADHAFQQGQQVSAPALDGRAVEQVGGVAQQAGHAVIVLLQGQAQVEARAGRGLLDRLQAHTLHPQVAGLLRLQGEQGLEHRAVAQVALRVHGLHHLLERQVLVGIGRHRGGLDARQ